MTQEEEGSLRSHNGIASEGYLYDLLMEADKQTIVDTQEFWKNFNKTRTKHSRVRLKQVLLTTNLPESNWLYEAFKINKD